MQPNRPRRHTPGDAVLHTHPNQRLATPLCSPFSSLCHPPSGPLAGSTAPPHSPHHLAPVQHIAVHDRPQHALSLSDSHSLPHNPVKFASSKQAPRSAKNESCDTHPHPHTQLRPPPTPLSPQPTGPPAVFSTLSLLCEPLNPLPFAIRLGRHLARIPSFGQVTFAFAFTYRPSPLPGRFEQEAWPPYHGECPPPIGRRGRW